MSLTKCVVKSTIRCHCCKRLYLMKQLLCFVTATPPQIGKMPLLYEKHSIELYYTLLKFTEILECIYERLFVRPAMLLQQITKALLTDSAPSVRCYQPFLPSGPAAHGVICQLISGKTDQATVNS